MGFFWWSGKKIFIWFFQFSKKWFSISLGVGGNNNSYGFVLSVSAAYSRQKGSLEMRAGQVLLVKLKASCYYIISLKEVLFMPVLVH